MERAKGTRTEQSAETELPAQVAGFLGLPHPAGATPPTCAETARSVRFAPRRGCGARRDQAGTRRCGSGPGHRPWPPGPRAVPAGDPPSPGLEAPGLPPHLAPGAARCPPPRERRFRARLLRRSAPGAKFAPAAKGAGPRQDSPSLSSGSSSSNRSPAAPAVAVAFAMARARRGRGKRADGWGSGCRRRGAALSLAAPCPPGARRTRETLGAQSVGARTPAALRCCAPGSGRGTEAGRARAAPEERAGAGR